jgi:hypothetical protein
MWFEISARPLPGWLALVAKLVQEWKSSEPCWEVRRLAKKLVDSSGNTIYPTGVTRMGSLEEYGRQSWGKREP